MIEDVTIIIPVYNPDDKFTAFLKTLHETGYRKIIVVDDGSRDETKKYFDIAKEEYGCHVVKHSINLGQGRAFKSAYNYYLSLNDKKSIGIIQCDCDGQHKCSDVNKCAELLRKKEDKLILGCRNFDSNDIPFRSRFGNKLTNLIFFVFCGLRISDTQTGLKGIPNSMIPYLMEVPGERFEYCSSTILATKDLGKEIEQFNIETIYINGNETSHFNPVIDSIRIYSLILKYCFSSISAFVIDIILFSIFISIFSKTIISDYYIIVSTYLAKIVSCSYTYFINKKYVFKNKSMHFETVIKFVFLCIIQSSLSGVLTNFAVITTRLNEVFCKIVIDTMLFMLSFFIQNNWVFKNKEKKNK